MVREEQQQPAAEEEAELQQEAEAEAAVYDAEAYATTAEAAEPSQQQLAQRQVVWAVPQTPQVEAAECCSVACCQHCISKGYSHALWATMMGPMCHQWG